MSDQTTFTRDEAIEKLTEIWTEFVLDNPEELVRILQDGHVGFFKLTNSELEIKLEETFQTDERYVVKS